MNEEKYFKTISVVNNNKNAFEWKEVPGDWYKKLDLPHYESGDLRDCYYTLFNKGLGVAIGSYYSRFYHDEDDYSRSLEYFITFFVQTNYGDIKGIKLITADEYVNYRIKKEPFSVNNLEENNTIKNIYDAVKEKIFDIDDLLTDLMEIDE